MGLHDYDSQYKYKTKIWFEEPEPDNPFAAKNCYCHGYNVYEDILPKATWFEYVFLLFKGEKPTKGQVGLLEKVAISITNPGPREASVRAAMNGGVAASPHAATLMSSLAVGAGQYGGSHEVYILVQMWAKIGGGFDRLEGLLLSSSREKVEDIWPDFEHVPGFDPNGQSCPKVVLDVLEQLSQSPLSKRVNWLKANREKLEARVGYPLSFSGVISASLADIGFDEHEACMLYLILRLPGAAAHSIEQRHVGWKDFPFYANAIKLSDDPGEKPLPDIGEFGL